MGWYDRALPASNTRCNTYNSLYGFSFWSSMSYAVPGGTLSDMNKAMISKPWKNIENIELRSKNSRCLSSHSVLFFREYKDQWTLLSLRILELSHSPFSLNPSTLPMSKYHYTYDIWLESFMLDFSLLSRDISKYPLSWN